MLQITLVLCVVLALSSALPFHHEWRSHWSKMPGVKTENYAAQPQWNWNKDNGNDDGNKMQQSVRIQGPPGPPGPAYGHEWSWNKLYDVDGSKLKQTSEVAVQEDLTNVCKSAVAIKKRNDGETIRRSYHICAQENPTVEMENVVACYYTTAACCLAGQGRPVSSHELTVNGDVYTVTFLNSSDGNDLCFRTTPPDVPTCVTGINCLPACTAPDPPPDICYNNTLTESEESCPDFVCECKEGYLTPLCCECERGYFKNTLTGTCDVPCRENLFFPGSCLHGVCDCKDGFSGQDCCLCSKNAVVGTCNDTSCQCLEGYAESDCCNCAENYYRATDGTCKPICINTAVTCTVNGCTECATGYAGIDCCDCAPNYYRAADGTCKPVCTATAVTCTVNGCTECATGYAGIDCCDCAPEYYRAADDTCKPICTETVVTCTVNGCTECATGYAGIDCCECATGYYRAADDTCKSICMETAVACTVNGCTECATGYAGIDCCDCASGYYRASDDTCKPICTETAVTCTVNGCTECATGYAGIDCCDCAPDYYRADDDTCKPICMETAVACTVNGCTECATGYAGIDCCDCASGYYRAADDTCKPICTDNAVTCTVSGCTECATGYAGIDCCDCASGYYRAADDTCKPVCTETAVTCTVSGCTECATGYTGIDCCDCHTPDYYRASDDTCKAICIETAVTSTCTEDGCTKCVTGYAGIDCCECASNYYRDADGTCKPICTENAVACTINGCTECAGGYAGIDCCDCAPGYYRAPDNICEPVCTETAVTCTVNGCTECATGYTGIDCCDCAPNYYRAADGTCIRVCIENAVIKTCSINGCTECVKGYTGIDCCTKICIPEQDVYFVVDGTHSNDAEVFCQEMYALELLSEASNPGSTLASTRIGSYLYPRSKDTIDSDIRYFRTGDLTCTNTVEHFHELMEALSRQIKHNVFYKINTLITLPAIALDLLARDIEFEIASGNAPQNRRRVIVTLTDGHNDGTEAELEAALQKIQKISDSITLIAGGIATAIQTNDMPAFTEQVMKLAGGKDRNTVIASEPVDSAGITLGLKLVEVMERNGAICANQTDSIIERLNNNGIAYCKCNIRIGCKDFCKTEPSICRTPPTAQCNDKKVAAINTYVAEEEVDKDSIETNIIEAVKNALNGIFKESK